jgi:hypothetical protein
MPVPSAGSTRRRSRKRATRTDIALVPESVLDTMPDTLCFDTLRRRKPISLRCSRGDAAKFSHQCSLCEFLASLSK